MSDLKKDVPQNAAQRVQTALTPEEPTTPKASPNKKKQEVAMGRKDFAAEELGSQKSAIEEPLPKDKNLPKHEEHPSSDDWEFVQRSASGSQILNETRDNTPKADHGSLGSSQTWLVLTSLPSQHVSPAAQIDSKVPDTTVQTEKRPEQSRSRAVSTQSERSNPDGGIHPPPGTPEACQYHTHELVDATGHAPDQHIVSLDSHTGEKEYHHCRTCSIRRAVLLRAAGNADNQGREPDVAADMVHPDAETNDQESFHRSPSRVFTKEEWQSLHDKFKAVKLGADGTEEDPGPEEKDGSHVEEAKGNEAAESARRKSFLALTAPGETAPSFQGAGSQTVKKQKSFEESSKRGELRRMSTEEDLSFRARLTRKRGRSSVSEPGTWGESSINSTMTQGSGHIPHSMVQGEQSNLCHAET